MKSRSFHIAVVVVVVEVGVVVVVVVVIVSIREIHFFYSVYALSFCNDDSTYQVIHSELTQQDGRERKTADVL